MSAPELKPCPFCGSDAKLMGGPMAQEAYSVWCKAPRGQRHHLDGLGYKEAEAVAAWNTRADLCDPTQDECARAEAAEAELTALKAELVGVVEGWKARAEAAEELLREIASLSRCDHLIRAFLARHQKEA